MIYKFSAFVIAFLLHFSGYSQFTSMCCYNGDQEIYKRSEICSALSFTSNREAEDVVDKILEQVGLKRNFIVIECPNIENAIAVNLPGELGQLRYIIYDNDFLERLNDQSDTDWAAISILAHEVGHHLNGHTLSKQGSNQRDELQADEFSGFIIAKLGGSLEEAQAAIKTVSNIQATDTHPGKYDRMAAIEIGWKKGNSKLRANIDNSSSDRNKASDEIFYWRNEKEISTIETGKKKMLFFYTDWCTWCKKMEKSINDSPELKKIIKDNFTPIKFNAETTTTINYLGEDYNFVRRGQNGYHALAAKLLKEKMSFPTVVYLDEQNKLIQPIPGYQEVETMKKICIYFAKDYYKTTPWDEFISQY